MNYLKKLTSRKLAVTAAVQAVVVAVPTLSVKEKAIMAVLALGYILAEAYVDSKAVDAS